MAVAPDEIGYPTEKEDNQNTFSAEVRTHNRFRRIIFQSLRNCQLLKSGGYAQNRVVSAKAIFRQLGLERKNSRHVLGRPTAL